MHGNRSYRGVARGVFTARFIHSSALSINNSRCAEQDEPALMTIGSSPFNLSATATRTRIALVISFLPLRLLLWEIFLAFRHLATSSSRGNLAMGLSLDTVSSFYYTGARGKGSGLAKVQHLLGKSKYDGFLGRRIQMSGQISKIRISYCYHIESPILDSGNFPNFISGSNSASREKTRNTTVHVIITLRSESRD